MMSDEQPSTSKDVEVDEYRSQSPQSSIYRQSDEGRIQQDSPEEQATAETLNDLLWEKLNIGHNEYNKLGSQSVMEELTFEGLTRYWAFHGFKKIVTMVGAGISTSAGIPDFRTPSVGLYSQLEAYNLPHPRAIFDIKYFKENPKPFFTLCKDLYPGSFKPTAAHYFVRLLNEKGVLLRHYTQNIDALERIAGIPEEKLVEAHGTFSMNHCITCKRAYSMKWMKEKILADEVPTCRRCNSLVKPDIVFYGEALPQKFIALQKQDFRSCDLLIIMGTSLEVEPFALLIDCVRPRCVRLLINRDRVAQPKGVLKHVFPNEKQPCLLYDCPENVRDIAYIGDCDDGVVALAEALGWGGDLKKLMDSNKA